jgi:glycosyltransferase involved in cell wall biosynthesis
MHLLIVNNAVIPALKYGGTERVIWYLGKELVKMGHKVTYLVAKGSFCDFANVIFINPERNLSAQIPTDIDLVHFNAPPSERIDKPYIVTIHGNSNDFNPLDVNAVFVSQNHASRYGSPSFVYNGLDWDDYGVPNLDNKRDYFHFLGKAAWKVKNVRGAIAVIKATEKERLKVLGGYRLNLNMGFRLTLSPRVGFCGMVGGAEKNALLAGSKGLIFPVRWSEPFGLALTESLYFGCPVFGTPYGSLPEIVSSEVGFLSDNCSELAQAVENSAQFSRKRCHEYALETFNAKQMAIAYLEKYTTVLNGATLHASAPKLLVQQTEKLLSWQEG